MHTESYDLSQDFAEYLSEHALHYIWYGWH